MLTRNPTTPPTKGTDHGTGALPAKPLLRARKIRFPFDSRIPKHWFADNAVATHVVNGVNLLFPAGERFFIRSVKHYMSRFQHDAAMTAKIRGFFAQEGSHAREHERFFALMSAHGYEINEFLRRFEWFCSRAFGRFAPPVLRLATTAACEHFTAIMAEQALQDGLLDQAHPIMRDLLRWHAAEEIEHKAVAFDVLERVSGSYLVRMAGLACATVVLGTWWMLATRMLLQQDGIDRQAAARLRRAFAHAPATATATANPTAASDAQMRASDIGRDVFWPAIRSYMRRDFHPDHHDNYHLAQMFLHNFAHEA